MADTAPDPIRKVVLAFMAHPDDAEIACGGTLARLSQLGWEIHIATATAGDCGTATLSPEEISAIRIRESVKAAELIGATYHCLHEPDGRLVCDRTALQKSIDLFREVAPSVVITMPMSDYHSDHEVTGQLGRAASFVYATPNASDRPLLPGSMVPYLYYCDGHGGVDRLGDPIEPTTRIDISKQFELKSRMLACHESQRSWLRQHNGIDEYLIAMREYSSRRGQESGFDFGEVFVQHRGHAHPAYDILTELLPRSNPRLQSRKSATA
ncbi:PIG-L deacetylase family protein [Aporhodopirellula aestuarii]|uniref:PIG-L family deacetylase n=1 Tax=Aporhodopirellula aestuarii TaxID=2950107 RepID=A0ABT0UBC8_9BACT|nr:PIG-L family deacetylase [Aporhodopirellula aestuarii]MCM2374307.1 PIG-L family deacetylase [Aporhodopirellula aestuarii]